MMISKKRFEIISKYLVRSVNYLCGDKRRAGLVIGVYRDELSDLHPGHFTSSGSKYNRKCKDRINTILEKTTPPPKLGEVRIIYDLEPKYCAIAVVGLGKRCLGYDSFEQMDEGKEAIRTAAAVGARALQALPLHEIDVESFGHAESAAEGAALAVWLYQEMKNKKYKIRIPTLDMYNDCDWIGWQIGLQKAAAQNLARQLTDTPANLMTPMSFAQNAVEVLCKSGVNVEVKVRGWAKTQNMNAFLAAAKGSCEPPIFLELSYYGTSRDERPVVLIGKGVTYNSGGLALRSCRRQKEMRGDMAGAAIVVAAIRAVSGLQLPINIRGLIPLCENMPGCDAMKPEDIIRAMNRKTIKLVTTDSAGRLTLADTLAYAQSFWPRFIVDIATNSNSLRHTTGVACSSVFTNSEALWEYMLAASMHTGDRVWRYPLWQYWGKLIRGSTSVDITTHGRRNNIRRSGSCKMAAFLNEFVPCGDWIHVDVGGVFKSYGKEYKYLREGMSGRPTRTIVEFLSQLVCNRQR